MVMKFETYQNWISEDEEYFLIEKFEAMFECPTGNILFRRFGGPHPAKLDYFQALCDRVFEEDLMNPAPNRVLLNRYFPGKITRGAHYDAETKNRWPSLETCSLGFGSDAMMEFTREGRDPVHLEIPRRQLLRLSGEFFNDWMHQVLPTENPRFSLVLWNYVDSPG